MRQLIQSMFFKSFLFAIVFSVGCSGSSGPASGDDGSVLHPDGSSSNVVASGRAGASVHYYFYQGLGMKRCPGRIAGYTTQSQCDALGRSQTENGAVNQVGLTCDTDPAGCIAGDELLVTATDRCPASARSVRVTYKTKTVQVRIVDRTPGNGGFDLGFDPYFDLGIYADFNIGVTGAQDIAYECLN